MHMGVDRYRLSAREIVPKRGRIAYLGCGRARKDDTGFATVRAVG